MVEILPIKTLADEDQDFFGSLNVALGKLGRSGMSLASGIVVTPPNLKLQTTLEHYDFGKREVFEQSLTLVKKEIHSIPVPENLHEETGKHKSFFVNSELIKSVKDLWLKLLDGWLEQIKERIWKDGFYKGITEGLEPQVVIFVNRPLAYGSAYFDPTSDDTVINTHGFSNKEGSLHPNDLKNLDEIVRDANKKLFIPHEYEWILDPPAGRQGGGIKLTKVLPYTPAAVIASVSEAISGTAYPPSVGPETRSDEEKSAVKVFLDLSKGLVVEKEVDGVYIASEKIFDLNKTNDSFEDLVFKLVECSATFPNSPILFKLADKSEGMGKIRGTLRLLHQKSLFRPMIDALDFVRHKRGITNIHPVIPFVRTQGEFLQIKRELAVKKLGRKNSLQLWLEITVPENIVNLEDYLLAGLDGIVLNLDELAAYFGGYDLEEGDMVFYKNEVSGLLKFLEDGVKLLHKSKVPFITYGSLSLYPQVLEYLVEKGVYGIVVERYEAPSAHELLRQAERRMVLRRSS